MTNETGKSEGRLARWWGQRSAGEQTAMIVLGGVVLVATGGAVAYAIATEGLIVATPAVIIAAGNAAKTLARAVV